VTPGYIFLGPYQTFQEGISIYDNRGVSRCPKTPGVNTKMTTHRILCTVATDLLVVDRHTTSMFAPSVALIIYASSQGVRMLAIAVVGL